MTLITLWRDDLIRFSNSDRLLRKQGIGIFAAVANDYVIKTCFLTLPFFL
jgi:hypothetical protein